MKFSDIEDAAESLNLRSLLAADLAWLREYSTKVGAEIRRVILFLNGGTAAALITYMGASETVRTANVAWTALALFGAGILCLCVSYAIGFHILTFLMSRTAKQQRTLVSDEMELEDYDPQRLAVPKVLSIFAVISWVFSYAAMACWIAGVAIAIVHLRPEAPSLWV